MNALLLSALILAAPASAAPKKDGFSGLFQRVSNYLNGKSVRRTRLSAGVAAVRGGIPTDQGEDLDRRLIDRAALLRAALLNKDPRAADLKDLSRVHDALALSQFVQALSVPGVPDEARADAAAEIQAWAGAPRSPALPAELKTLLSGPASRIDDKTLVESGWGRYARGISPASTPRASSADYAASEEAARLDETLKGLSDAWLQRKLSPEDEAKAHLLAGQVHQALATADLRGVPASAAGVSAKLDLAPAPVETAASAPAAPAPAFDPKAIYQSASKSTVLLVCGSPEGSGELGTGSVIDSRGLILTNSHVVIRDSTRKPWPVVRVYFKPAKMTGDPKRDMQSPIEGEVVAWEPKLDLALVRLPSLPASAKPIPLGDPESLDIGDRVAAIGHPEQGGLWTLTTGVVSALVADLGGVKGKDAFQTDASINRGNSGGPLLDASGRLVGVNTSMSRKAADGLAITAVNFSVRSDVVKRWLASGAGLSLAYGGGPAPAALAAKTPMPKIVEVARPAPPAEIALAPKPAATVKKAPEPKMITEGKPFDDEDLIQAGIAEMEDLETEMRNEIKLKTGR